MSRHTEYTCTEIPIPQTINYWCYIVPVWQCTCIGHSCFNPICFLFISVPSPPVISCKSFKGNSSLLVIMNKAFGEAHSFYVECEGLYCPQSPVRVNVNQEQASEYTFPSLKPFTDYSIKVKSKVVYGSNSKQSVETTKTCSTSQSGRARAL